MGRTSESLQHALIMRVLPKIQNKKTGTAYKKHIKSFSKWAREHGYRRPDQITKDVIQEYEQHLEGSPKGYSPATIHAYLSPVCSAAGINMEEIRKPKRTAGSIVRGRRQNADGQEVSRNRQGDRQANNPKYARLVALQRVTGIRRSELGRLKGEDLVERGHSLYVHVRRGKGGKSQLQYILPQDRQAVREIFANVEPDQKVFTKEEMSNTINLHGLRSAHGRDCYQHYVGLITTKQGAADSLRQTLLRRWEAGHERLRESDPKAWERQRERFVADCDDRPYRLRGENLQKAQTLGLPEEYNRLALMCVSVFHLSHWRLDVTVTNYIIG
jgi:integrase